MADRAILPGIRGIPETMVCRILMFMGSFHPHSMSSSFKDSSVSETPRRDLAVSENWGSISWAS